MPKKGKPKAESDDEESEEGTEDKKKPAKKKINPVILVVVVGALAALFLIEDDAETPSEAPATSFKKPERKKKVKPQEGTPATDTAATETPATDTAATETPATDTAATETPATDTAATETPATDTAATETPATDTAATETPATDTAATETPATDTAATETPATDTAATETPATDTAATETPATDTADTVEGQTPDVADESTLTDKILQDLEKQAKTEKPKEVKKEYVAPPDYEYRGRGLVYNCAGKHWACVDAPSYKVCEDNHSSTNFLKKKVECYPFNIYETVKGCELMQNRVVSSNAKTNFCNGN